MASFEIKVAREIEVVTFNVAERDDLMLVYSRWSDTPKKFSRQFVWKKDFEKGMKSLKEPGKFKDATIKNQNSEDYPFRLVDCSIEGLKKFLSGDRDYDLIKSKEVWAQPVPKDNSIYGYEAGYMSFVDAQGEYMEFTLVDFYLDRDYDLAAMIEGLEGDSKYVVGTSRYGRLEKIYYVRGNGATLNVGVKLTSEEARDYWAGRKVSFGRDWIDKNTRIGEFKREEERREDEEDDSYFDEY